MPKLPPFSDPEMKKTWLKLATFLDKHSLRPQLTPQELNVMYWSLQGYNNPAIAQKLNVKESTIKTHKNNLIAKLGLQGREEFQKFLLKIASSPP
ncbi:helix-turn-helix transcriptional regulator [Runella sp. MFBS21]|jgi:DNA-binding CsgD family transcriptional regulator|uniref:helix-turn-helix transcriptional regulator n=1 Tax=Runella TaxID=105 RepID=UPI000407AB74|nr:MULTISPECIES: helix-turn-helix transcriptional regulator [Runella]MDF7816495.1 helix-turn-helix transcriptional regulator [Runella sp. MFBS21]